MIKSVSMEKQEFKLHKLIRLITDIYPWLVNLTTFGLDPKCVT